MKEGVSQMSLKKRSQRGDFVEVSRIFSVWCRKEKERTPLCLEISLPVRGEKQYMNG